MNEKKQMTKDDVINIIAGETAKMRPGGVWGVYTRVSRMDPREPGYSMEVQPDRAIELAKSHGAQDIKLYEDPGQSGKNSKRDGLQNMIYDAKAGRLDVLVFHRVDRLFRNLESLLELVKLLKKNKIKIVSVLENIDTDNWWGRLVLIILGSLAEAYVLQASENTRSGLHRRRMNGRQLGRIPVGYCNGLCSTCKDENGKDYCPLYGGQDRPESQRGKIAVPHPVDRHLIPLIYKLYQDGMSFREVANYLNNNFIKLPDGKEVLFRPRGKRVRHANG